MKNDINGAVRIMEVVPIDSIKGAWDSEFDKLALYELVAPGVLKPNCGLKKNKSDVLVFDVTNASPELKAQLGGNIREMKVSQIIGVSKEMAPRAGKITAVIPLDGVYTSLGRGGMEALGHDYVQVIQSDEGLKVVPVITTKAIPDNLMLRVHPERLSEELAGKISGEIVELCEKEPGLYENVVPMSQGMDL